MTKKERIFITGAAGFIGARVLAYFRDHREEVERVIATDIRDLPEELRGDHIESHRLDIRDENAVRSLMVKSAPTRVIHLAAMVTPPPGDHRKLQYEVDVLGTRNVVAGAIAAGARQFIYTSSGAAYGYHQENPVPLLEDEPLRGNEAFAYSHHKRLVEEDLARTREAHQGLKQLIFRVSTVLGPETDNQITALFEQSMVTGLRGIDAPFCIIADEDVVGAILHGIKTEAEGIYNLTGDGILTLEEIAALMGGRYVGIPEGLIATGLRGLSALKLSPYGPEQVLFLKYRPVLDNSRLKSVFGYRPQYTTEEAFERYRCSRAPLVLITGAAGNLGGELARIHGLKGHRLVLLDRDQEGLERVYHKMRALGFDAMARVVDLQEEQRCKEVIQEVDELYGGLDILYNNAAIPLRGLAEEVSAEEVRRLLDINVLGAVRMTTACLPLLEARKGRIGVVSSVAGFAPLTGRTAYAAGKHALHGYFETLRSEVRSKGISVTMICPSYLRGSFRKDATDGARELDVAEAAEKIVGSVMNRESRILVGTTAQLAWWVSRLTPGIYEELMRRSVKAEFPLE